MSELYPSDQYGYSSLLSEPELAVLARLRSALEASVQPLLADHWDQGTFPDEIVQPLVDLSLMDPPELEGEAPSALYCGFRNFELARTDASVATFYNAQSGLFRTTVTHGGSLEQAARWDPDIRSFALTGVFCLAEPDHGSDIAGGLATVARRSGDRWILDGAKRWIGGATSADYLAVFARDEADGEVKAFLVRSDAPGVQVRTIPRKASLRIMQNCDITLVGVEVDEEYRLQRVDSFRDVASLLRSMRSDVAWIATGAQAGAYEAALRYVLEREQFGRPIAGFQLIQEKLAIMLGNLTSSLAMVVGVTQQQHQGVFRDESSALAKMFCSLRLRETTRLAREVMGGNGILLDYDVARFHADAEAICSYEGTHEMNALIVGRAITGISAFR